MSDRPNAQDLLQTAREELLQRLLPALPSSLRYQALMIANALAIATRELACGVEGDQQEARGMRSLLQAASSPEDEMKLASPANRKELCAQIRAGKFDPATPQHAQLLRHLDTTVRAKLAISNPRLLESGSA